MEEMLSRLELMLIGLRQMKTTVVFTWFPKINKDDILRAIEESPKFKIVGDVVMLKSETEIYEEELQKEVLKELMNEKDDEIDILDDYDDIELIEIPLETLEDLNNDIEIIEEVKETEEIEIIEDEIEIVNEEITEEAKVEEAFKEACASKIIEEVEEKVEQVVERVIVKDTASLNGAEIKYEELVRLIREYSANTLNKLSLSDIHKFEMQEKAITTFYSSKYNVRIKERNFYGSDTNIYALIHKKRGMEVGYLVICNVLTEEILNYMLDNYDDEVVYFLPLAGSEVRFEVGLNEFFLKDSGIILDKYLEHYEISDECDFNIKKVEVVIGR
ncbi:hypothetical protein [Clostridium chrysemydis]|uniref:hypothetical protein n=1 Tax=Clostridium chrysemydis TaxID=2665504 RepID=UPI0018839FBF|nr:hypothetical protein [Clostridium chrysemydis]